MEKQKIARIAKCLWEFQEMTPEISGLILLGAEGFVIASTLSYTPATTRLAAVASALVALGRQASEEWSRGSFEEIRVRYKDAQDRKWDVQLLPISPMITLAVITQRPPLLSVANIVLSFNTQQAAHYIGAVLGGETAPPPVTWM